MQVKTLLINGMCIHKSMIQIMLFKVEMVINPTIALKRYYNQSSNPLLESNSFDVSGYKQLGDKIQVWVEENLRR